MRNAKPPLPACYAHRPVDFSRKMALSARSNRENGSISAHGNLKRGRREKGFSVKIGLFALSESNLSDLRFLEAFMRDLGGEVQRGGVSAHVSHHEIV